MCVNAVLLCVNYSSLITYIMSLHVDKCPCKDNHLGRFLVCNAILVCCCALYFSTFIHTIIVIQIIPLCLSIQYINNMLAIDCQTCKSTIKKGCLHTCRVLSTLILCMLFYDFCSDTVALK